MGTNNIKLTKQQKDFCYNYVYITDFEPISAIKMAGYNVSDDNSAHAIKRELLRNPKVKAHISDLIHERDADTALDKVFVIEKLKKVIKETEKNYNPHLKALELLGKHLGMFSEKEGNKEKETPSNRAKELFNKRISKILPFKKEGEDNGGGKKQVSETNG